MFHTDEYLNNLKKLSALGTGQDPKYGLGPGDCPVFPQMHEISSMLVGGHLDLMESLIEGKISYAIGLIGGLHHAHFNRASGFCYYNDSVISIKHALKLNPELKVLYLDIDCHHGDGVQEAFYSSNQVLTLSFHESGQFLFPGTGDISEMGQGIGTGYSLNVPLPPYCPDSLFLTCFEQIFPRVMEIFNPDLIYLQGGTDTHFTDPLTHMSLSNNLYVQIMKSIRQGAEDYCKGKLFFSGGGGYNPDSTARSWALMSMILCDSPIPQDAPKSWIDYCEQQWKTKVSDEMLDKPLPGIVPKQLEDYTKNVLEFFHDTAFPFLEKIGRKAA